MRLFNLFSPLPSAPPAFAMDFVPQRRRPSVLGWIILLAGLLVSIAVALEYLDQLERLDDATRQLTRAQRLHERATGKPSTRKEDRVPDPELLRAAQLAGSLQAPWMQLMPQLENAGNADIALLSLDADTHKAQINVAGEARSLEAVFAYAERIGAQTGFSSVQVQNYEFHKTGKRDSVQFKLSARWRDAA